MFYLIETDYVGPNKKDAGGNWIGDSRIMSVATSPGTTNQSHEPRTEGWLGTTNDNYAYAHGEFETLESAREAAHEMGYTCEYTPADNDYYQIEREKDGVVEQWISEEANREQWDAGDWFINGLGRAGTCEAYGITADTTDDELDELVDRAEEEAIGEGAELHGCMQLFTELRDDLRAERDDDDDE